MELSTHAVVLGAGPAGTGPLLFAIQRGRHAELLDRGVVWLDQGERMVAGSIGGYDITSDTASDVLLECLAGQDAGALAGIQAHPATEEVRTFLGGPLPLPVMGRYLAALGDPVHRLVKSHAPRSRFVSGATVTRVEVTDGGFVVHAHRAREAVHVRARRLLTALGGEQCEAAMLDAEIARDLRLRGQYEARTVLTSRLVTTEGQAKVLRRLGRSTDPRVVILGGSHSAMTAAWILLRRSGIEWSPGAIAVLARRLPTLFYPSLVAAHADGYTRATVEDVCPVTGRVHRLSGLRLAARDLVRAVWGLGGPRRETRVRLESFDPETDAPRLRAELDRADLIVPAFGYSPRTVPFFRDEARLPLLSETSHRAPLVDGACRVLLASGEPLPGAYAMGLASGFVPHGELGGESSFRGQTNGLWLYQNGIGEIVMNALLG